MNTVSCTSCHVKQCRPQTRIPLTSKFHLQPTCTENMFAYNIPSSSCDYHLQSFFPRTVRDWNTRRSGRSSPPDVTSFFSHNKHNRCIYSRKQGNMNWFFRYWRIFMQYINLQISTTQLKITVIEYVTNRRSMHLQLNFVKLGQTVPFTKPQTKSE